MFTKRSVLGAITSLVLVGELLVLFRSGLFSLIGVVVFFFLYLTYFLIIDAYRAHYKPSLVNQTLFNFALYSVLITGFFHGELINFLRPSEVFITTLIRVQSALFIVFVFPVVDRFTTRSPRAPGLARSFLYFFIFVLLMSASPSFGFRAMMTTIQTAPIVSILFTALAGVALHLSARSGRTTETVPLFLSILLGVFALVPEITWFLIYAPLMIVCYVLGIIKYRENRRS